MTSAAMPERVALDPPPVPADDGAGTAPQVIETRFGPMEFAADDALHLPRGILGFAEHRDFGLAFLPNKFIDQLMLLQSLDDAGTSFLVLPVATNSGVIEDRDLSGACSAMDIDVENAVMLLIVTIRDTGGQPQVTVNLRAPVIVDSASRRAWQYVLPNAKYPTRHPLNVNQPEPAEAGGE